MTDGHEPPNDQDIRTIVDRLARRNASGGKVIERAAILAEGTSSAAILRWITSNDWEPEDAVPTAPGGRGGGLHSERRAAAQTAPRAPARYVLRPDAE